MNLFNVLYNNVLTENVSPKSSGGWKDKIDWRNVKWEFSNKAIGSYFNIPPYMVQHYRKVFAPETVQSHLGSKNIDWNRIDWKRKSDEQISTEINVTIPRIKEKRAQLAPKTIKKPKEFNPTFKERQKNINWNKIDWNKSRSQLTSELGVAPATINYWRKRLAPHTITTAYRPKVDWRKVDWRKPTSQLARELKANIAWVSAKRRQLAPHTVRGALDYSP